MLKLAAASFKISAERLAKFVPRYRTGAAGALGGPKFATESVMSAGDFGNRRRA